MEISGLQSHRTPNGENPCEVHGLWRVGLLGVPSPRYSYPLSYRDSRSCFCLGESGRFQRTWSYFCGAYSSRALHRFIIRTDRSPDWFRLLSHCLGRTGRHRRIDRNRSVPGLIPIQIYDCLSFYATDCQISGWLSLRGLVQNCRIHPAAEAAGILLVPL